MRNAGDDGYMTHADRWCMRYAGKEVGRAGIRCRLEGIFDRRRKFLPFRFGVFRFHPYLKDMFHLGVRTCSRAFY